MEARKLEIARGEEILGAASESEARELLQIGFLQPTDLFRPESSTAWRPLSDLSPAQPSSLLKRAVPAAKTLIATAAGATHTVKKLTTRGKASATDATAKVLDVFIPQIRIIVARVADTSAFRAVKAGVQNDDFMRKLFGAAYDCLPRPVQRFVGEERFVTYCMARRQKLLASEPAGS